MSSSSPSEQPPTSSPFLFSPASSDTQLAHVNCTETQTQVTKATAMAGTRALYLLVAAVAALLATPAAVDAATLAEICRGTAFPDICTSTVGSEAQSAGVLDAMAVLRMQVDAFNKRTEAARAHVKEAAVTASPKARTVLDLCNNLYLDVEDNLGACRRAIGFKDAVTIRATMGMAAQDMQNCDEQFRQIGEKNPMEQFDASLVEMSENCRSLSNMI
ncbi:Pectinesterase inhibitor domain containing protein [Zea mays]|uniref:Pectinesterase inhibitor domain containing protein n=3 Tax=Zea mays TaxID=4577 RepID=A0A1D6FC44_MAIZE|nr:Pectinesterase inhibitor domain containing protein [Zea mays]